MPELPEVETIRRDLIEKILNRKINTIELRLEKIVKNPALEFKKIINNNEFTNISRRGKLLIFHLKTGEFLLVHLKMTGQLIFRDHKQTIAGGHSEKNMTLDVPNKYSHVIFSFKNKSQLFFNDLRQFGYLKIVNQKELKQITEKFGPELIDENFTFTKFEKLLHNRKRNIKAFLLDQTALAGIGNIYADEILFKSQILPTRNLSTLTKNEIKTLFKNIKKILTLAITHRGTTFNNYVDSNGNKGGFLKFLKVYNRSGQKCLNCQNEIQKTKIAGRGTNFCPHCQK
jgi:formamidopyrimidine-DNA glycosylase